MHPYFDVNTPHILAHRGFARGVHENSIDAFRNAIAAGATHIETDAHVTRDGVTILFHDAEYEGRLLTEIDSVELPPWIPHLDEVLRLFPDTRFNIDIKSELAVQGVADAIKQDARPERFLLASFSERRRKKTVKLIPAAATSASGIRFAIALLGAKSGLSFVVRWALKGIDAVQIPRRALAMSTDSARVIAAFHHHHKIVHYWTINEAQIMQSLIERGADGIVTDETKRAVEALRQV